MTFLKKNIIKIGLILALIVSAVLCIYTTVNYKTNSNGTQNKIEQNNSFRGGENQPPNFSKQMTNGQNSSQHMGPPDGNMSAPNGNMAGTKGNMQGGNWGITTKYAPMLTAYSATFLILFIGGYYFFIRKKMKISPSNEKVLIFTLLSIGLLLRISASTLMQGHNDINLFKNWATSAANSLSQFYTSARSADYPPLYIYVLYLIGKVSSISIINPYFILLLKLPSIIADIATSYFIYKIAKKYLSAEISLLISVFYIFNPAIFIDSTFWGQVDSFFTFLVVLSVFLLSEKKIGFSAVSFTAAVLMKPQGIIFLPILFFELIRQRSLKSFLKVAGSALITALVIILPFSLNQGPLWIFKLFSSTISEYPYASVNAFNFFCLLGANYKNNTATLFILSYHSWGMIFIVAITALSWFMYIKGNSRKFAPVLALLQIVGVFTFSAGMHERYLFPAVALSILAFIYLKDKRLLIVALGLSITVYTNIYAILFGASRGMNSASSSPILMVTSFLNVMLCVYLIKILFDIVIKKRTYTYE